MDREREKVKAVLIDNRIAQFQDEKDRLELRIVELDSMIAALGLELKALVEVSDEERREIIQKLTMTQQQPPPRPMPPGM